MTLKEIYEQHHGKVACYKGKKTRHKTAVVITIIRKGRAKALPLLVI